MREKLILLTGGSGLLGSELLKIDSNLICPTHKDLDIRDLNKVSVYLTENKPDILIHSAAILNDNVIKNKPEEAIHTNIVGTANLAMLSCLLKIRIIYISSDYIYQGTEGNYSENDPILPYNFYSWTKLGGEASVRGVKNHLIIRTTFGPSKFPYKQAFSDAYRSKDYVDVIAPMIYEAAISNLQGVINIGTKRKTMYEYAKERNPSVNPIKIENSGFNAPFDTSFNLDKWKNYKNGTNI